MKKNYLTPTCSVETICVEQGIAISNGFGTEGAAGNIMSESEEYIYDL